MDQVRGSALQESSDGEDGAQRFAFGENWLRFLELVDDARIDAAVDSMKDYLGVSDLSGKTFLDVGSGSGLFSLAARRLGAKVRSFDFDSESVACTQEMRRRFGSCDESDWLVEQGSILDENYVRSLGEFDVVYSWGVLHHTGAMERAFDLVSTLVRPGGTLYISIYNDQGRRSLLWRAVKRRYTESGRVGRTTLLTLARGYFGWHAVRGRLLSLITRLPASRHKITRGMDKERDLVDWVGGYPFEVASPERVFDFFHHRGFSLERLKTCRGDAGCNEYVFSRPVLHQP